MSIKKVYLELTNKCNLNCSICYRRSWGDKAQDMSFELFHKVKREIDEIDSVKTIVLGGIGEPTCAPLICDAIEALGNKNLIMTTNAVSLNDTMLNNIVKYVNTVMISIDGLYENFLKIRGTNLDVVLDNIRKINELKEKAMKNTPFIGIQFVITKDNIGDIFELIDLLSSLKVSILVLSNLLPQTKENSDKIIYTRYDNKEVKHLFNRVLNYSYRKGINIVLPNCELKTERRCSFIDDDTVFISSSGEILPCYRLSHSYKEFVFGREKSVVKHSFGSLTDNGLMEIWESREYSSFRSIINNNKYPSCIDCDLLEGCDMVRDTECDCYAVSPSCADCLWSRKFMICP